MTADEARQVLNRVQAAVRGQVPEARVVGIIEDANTAYTGRRVLERSRLVDPLLDIRLVIGT